MTCSDLASTAADYVAGRLAVHAHIGLRVGDLDAGTTKFCAVFQRTEGYRETALAEYPVLVRVGKGVTASRVRLQSLQECACALASEITIDESSNEGTEQWQRFYEQWIMRDIPAGFRLELDSGMVRLTIKERAGVFVHYLGVFTCPLLASRY